MTGRTEVPAEFRPRQDQSPMTDRQKAYILDLIGKRSMTDEQRTTALARLEVGLSKSLASAWIERLQELPKQTSNFEHQKSDLPEISPGRYALGTDEPGDEIKFYKVSIGAEDNPRWAGFVFLDAIGGDETYPIKDFAKKKAIIASIAEDPAESSMKYGLHKMHCGVCGRGLTKKESRERGIGPICAERMGW